MLPRFNIPRWEIRMYEIIPGLIACLMFIIPVVMVHIAPKLLSYVILLFYVYWLLRSVDISKHLIIAYQRLRRSMKIHWLERLQACELPFEDIIHVIIIPAYNESEEILNHSLHALTQLNYDLKKVWVVLTIEERGGQAIAKVAENLQEKYQTFFGRYITCIHPDGIVGEAKAKGANISYAAREVEKILLDEFIDFKRVLVSSIDSDSAMSKDLLAHFTYRFVHHEHRHTTLFQFIPMYYNNFWTAPGFTRVIATGSAFWTMIESTRQSRFRTFACYGMSWYNLKTSNYWDKTSIIEDGVQYWRNIFAQRGKATLVEPVYSLVYMDAVLAGSWKKTAFAQYKQLRRWAWGASDLAYIVPYFRRMKCFSWKEKALHIFRLLENHITWSTVPLILLFAGQIPLINSEFSQTVLGSNMPVITSWILTISLLGLTVAIAISTLLLPSKEFSQKSIRYGFKDHILHILPWIFAPFITIVYGALPALHSQIQLMLGKKMETFVVTEKQR